jgi:hypothetical protein
VGIIMIMDKQLLTEYMPFTFSADQINESVNSGGAFVVSGILQRADAKNQNGRVYPRDILVREVRKYEQKFIKNRNALGELDHPESSVVNLKNVSHNIRSIKFQGDEVIGVVEVLPTPSGNILKELFKNNITLGISSRGMGSVKPLGEGTLEVQDDFELIAFDFVSNPSTQGAFLTPVNEGIIIADGELCNEYCKAQDIIRKILSELQ